MKCYMYVSYKRHNVHNRNGGVMVREYGRSQVQASGQTKEYNIGICFFSAKHVAFIRKSKEWLARNQDNASEWGAWHIYPQTFVSVSQHYKHPSKGVGLV